MPFTVSHAAAVLPIPHKRLPLSALVIGSMAPDFLYFLLLGDKGHLGHTTAGLFLFCLPVGLAVLFVYDRFWKEPALAMMPDAVRLRVSSAQTFRFGPLARFAWIVAALLLGSLTHIAWDGFTHLNGYFVKHIAVLRQVTPFWPHGPAFVILQHASSVVGLFILAAATGRWTRRTPPATTVVPPLRLQTRVIAIGIASAIAIGFGVIFGYQSAQQVPEIWLAAFADRTVIGAMTAGIVEFSAFAAWWHLRKHKALELEGSRARISGSAELSE